MANDTVSAGGDGCKKQKLEKPHDEMQYLNLIRNIIENGNEKMDRTSKKFKMINSFIINILIRFFLKLI